MFVSNDTPFVPLVDYEDEDPVDKIRDKKRHLDDKINSLALSSANIRESLIGSYENPPKTMNGKRARFILSAEGSLLNSRDDTTVDKSGNIFPNELLKLIFQNLKYRELVRTSHVCRSWKTAANDEQLWKMLYSTTFDISNVDSNFHQTHQGKWKLLFAYEFSRGYGKYKVSNVETFNPSDLNTDALAITSMFIEDSKLFAWTQSNQLHQIHLESHDHRAVYNFPASLLQGRILGIHQEMVYTADSNDTVRVFRIANSQVECVFTLAGELTKPQFIKGYLIGVLVKDPGVGMINFISNDKRGLFVQIPFDSHVKEFKFRNGYICCIHQNNTISMLNLSTQPSNAAAGNRFSVETLFTNPLPDLTNPSLSLPDFWDLNSDTFVAAWKETKTVAAWDIKSRRKLFEVPLTPTVNQVAAQEGSAMPEISSFDFDGKHCAVGFQNGVFILINARTGEQIMKKEHGQNEINKVAIDRNMCWTFSRSGSIKSWPIPLNPGVEYELSFRFGGYEEWIDDINITDILVDGKRIVTGNNLGVLKIWEFYPFPKITFCSNAGP